MRDVANPVVGAFWTGFWSSAGAMATLMTGQTHVFRRFFKVWARGLLKLWRVRVRVDGAQHLDPAGTYIFMANHLSFVDIPVLVAALPVTPGFVGKGELRRMPFVGRAMRAGGHVFVQRGSGKAALEAVDQAAALLRQGHSLVVFPEGTRGDGRMLGALQSGAFRLAKGGGVPIVPVGVRGTHRSMPAGTWRIAPAEVAVSIGEPIAYERIQHAPTRELMQEMSIALAAQSGLATHGLGSAA